MKSLYKIVILFGLVGLISLAGAQGGPTQILAIAGSGYGCAPCGGDTYSTVVDVIDGAESGKTCSPVPNYPVVDSDHTAAFYNGRVHSCGQEGCFTLGKDLVWQLMEPLPVGRTSAQSSVVKGMWWITGGDTYDYKTLNSTVLFDGISFSEGPKMPTPKSGHCQVNVNDTHIFFTGGFTTPESYLFNWETQEWITLATVPRSTTEAICGLLNNASHGLEILYAFTTNADRYTYIYNFEDDEWREGSIMPEILWDSSSVQLEDGVVSLGGRLNIATLRKYDLIFKFREDTYEWETFDQHLIAERDSFPSVAVPDDFLDCN